MYLSFLREPSLPIRIVYREVDWLYHAGLDDLLHAVRVLELHDLHFVVTLVAEDVLMADLSQIHNKLWLVG